MSLNDIDAQIAALENSLGGSDDESSEDSDEDSDEELKLSEDDMIPPLPAHMLPPPGTASAKGKEGSTGKKRKDVAGSSNSEARKKKKVAKAAAPKPKKRLEEAGPAERPTSGKSKPKAAALDMEPRIGDKSKSKVPIEAAPAAPTAAPMTAPKGGLKVTKERASELMDYIQGYQASERKNYSCRICHFTGDSLEVRRSGKVCLGNIALKDSLALALSCCNAVQELQAHKMTETHRQAMARDREASFCR